MNCPTLTLPLHLKSKDLASQTLGRFRQNIVDRSNAVPPSAANSWLHAAAMSRGMNAELLGFKKTLVSIVVDCLFLQNSSACHCNGSQAFTLPLFIVIPTIGSGNRFVGSAVLLDASSLVRSLNYLAFNR
jgi:hypothetical protein